MLLTEVYFESTNYGIIVRLAKPIFKIGRRLLDWDWMSAAEEQRTLKNARRE